MLVLSPYWQRERNENVESLKGLKALVLHDTSGECLTNSVVEVEEIASRAGFQRVPVHQGGVGEVGRCGAKSGQWLAPADSDLASVVGSWIDGRQLPDHLGADEPVMTATERVVFLAGKSGRMEVTVYTPHGKGPFPLLVFNHGDVDVENPSVRYGQRFREPMVSTVFLEWGFAVAVPARPGVGRSEGLYRKSFARNDGDPTYKARVHSEAILAVLEGLKQESNLNLDQVLLSGQSAGGDAVMYMSTLAIPGVRGVVNFSGGRNNNVDTGVPTFENRMMVDGWAEIGQKAKVPAMLVFAENDSRYSANTIRKSTQAFKDAGGKADLLLLPPQKGDGHAVYHNPAQWKVDVLRFVTGLSMGDMPSTSP